MNTSTTVIIATLLVIIVGMAVGFSYLQQEISQLKPQTPIQSPTPTSSKQITPTPINKASPTPTNQPTTGFNPVLSAQPLSYNGFAYPPTVSIHIKQSSNATNLNYNDLKILPGDSYNYIETSPNGTVILSSNSVNNKLINGVYTFWFSVNLANPATSINSSIPYAIQFVVTHIDGTSISLQDAALVVVVQNSFNLIDAQFGGRPTYNYVNLKASANYNKLTYLCNPNVVDNLQDVGGSIIYSDFNKTLQMTISFATTGNYNLSINIVPAS